MLNAPKELVEEACRTGVFRDFNPRLVAELTAYAWERAADPAFRKRRGLTRIEAYEELLQLLQHGLLKE